MEVSGILSPPVGLCQLRGFNVEEGLSCREKLLTAACV
jgi:hypothetical protein